MSPPAAGVAQRAQAHSGQPGGGATAVRGGPARPQPAEGRGPWEAAAVNSLCLGLPQGVTRWDASPGGAAVFGAILRAVGAPGHTRPLAVDVAASGWTRAASPAMFAGGQHDVGTEKVKNLQICDLKSCVPTHRKAESKAVVRPPAHARLRPGPQEGSGSAAPAQHGRLRGSGAGRGPSASCLLARGHPSWGDRARGPQGLVGACRTGGPGRQKVGVPLRPGADREDPWPRVSPAQHPSSVQHVPSVLSRIRTPSPPAETSHLGPRPLLPPAEEPGIPSEPRFGPSP